MKSNHFTINWESWAKKSLSKKTSGAEGMVWWRNRQEGGSRLSEALDSPAVSGIGGKVFGKSQAVLLKTFKKERQGR